MGTAPVAARTSLSWGEIARRGPWDLAHRALGKNLGSKLDRGLTAIRTTDYATIDDLNLFPMTQIFNATGTGFNIDLGGNFTVLFGRQLNWLVERLKVSTAGYRGLVDIAELLMISSSVTNEVQTHLAAVAVSRKYKPQQIDLVNLAVVAAASQGIANWINENFHPGARRVFLGNDVRLQSPQAAELSARIFIANGIEVYRDTDPFTATPITSYAAYWLNTRSALGTAQAKTFGNDPFMGMMMEESGGGMMGTTRALHNRSSRWIFGSAGAVQDTSSHNPPGENGKKVSDRHGGVATDDITSGQAQAVTQLIQDKGIIRVAPRSALSKIHYIDAKEVYWENYAKYIFTKEVLTPLALALKQGYNYLFDGLQGVGGATFGYMLKRMEAVVGLPLSRIKVTNADPNPLLGKIHYPDPTAEKTIDDSGDLQVIADDSSIRCFVLADADADRTGPGVRIALEDGVRGAESKDVIAARRLGLFVSIMTSKTGKEVPIIRFTPNQLFSLIAFARGLDYVAERYGITDAHQAIAAVRSKKVTIPNLVTLTTVPSTRQLAGVAQFFGGKIITTATGFKYLGSEVGKMENASTKLAHHDKDTSLIAAYLFALDAKLALNNMNLFDLYKMMAVELGGLYYYDRQDMTLPTDQIKDDIMAGAEELEKAENGAAVATLLGKKALEVVAGVKIKDTVLMDEVNGEVIPFNPTGYRIHNTDGTYFEVFHAGAKGKDGPCLTLYDANDKLIYWTCLRKSGTEPIIRWYSEISEQPNAPRPAHLITYLTVFARHLGIPEADIKDRAKRIIDRYDFDMQRSMEVSRLVWANLSTEEWIDNVTEIAKVLN